MPPILKKKKKEKEKEKEKEKTSMPPSLPSVVAAMLYLILDLIYSCWLAAATIGCCCSSDPRSTSVGVHTHTRVESSKVW